MAFITEEIFQSLKKEADLKFDEDSEKFEFIILELEAYIDFIKIDFGVMDEITSGILVNQMLDLENWQDRLSQINYEIYAYNELYKKNFPFAPIDLIEDWYEKAEEICGFDFTLKLYQILLWYTDYCEEHGIRYDPSITIKWWK